MTPQPPPALGPIPLLRLYVAGQTPGARRALEGRQRLIDAMAGQVEIEIVDILADRSAAETAGILATPTLSDESSRPPRRLIGDLGDVDQVLDFFGLKRRI
ncbi:circadian clock KaiB family protein [Inquilinus limosus]|uniref:circadian clock KaiB family protein n=1 Tax=Inquilinus limosus TaxID=171674 RepID=UPI00054D2B37|nr:circadian clock KaiB family protein [Inquilinus limosus]